MLDGPNGNQMQFHNMMQHMQSMQIHTEQRPFHQFHPPPPRGDFNSYISNFEPKTKFSHLRSGSVKMPIHLGPNMTVMQNMPPQGQNQQNQSQQNQQQPMNGPFYNQQHAQHHAHRKQQKAKSCYQCGEQGHNADSCTNDGKNRKFMFLQKF